MPKSRTYYFGLVNEMNAVIEDIEAETYVANERMAFLFELAAEAITELRPAEEDAATEPVKRGRAARQADEKGKEAPATATPKKSPRYPKPCTNGRHKASDGAEQRCIKCGQLPKGVERQTTVPGAS